jgi:hypothetical protein
VGVKGRTPLGPVDGDHELLAGGERLGLRDQRLERDDARLGAEDEVLRRLQLPERAETEGVGREHALVGVPGDQGDRPLREGPEGRPQVEVEGMELLGEDLDLVDDRRHHHLHRLGEAEPIASDQGLDRPVQVL